MNTYDLPEEPEGPLWGPTEDGEGWIEYWRQEGPDGRWYQAKYASTTAMYSLFSWWELLGRGPLVDEDPRITLDVLADRVLGAAMTFREYLNEGRPLRERVDAENDLGAAVDAYVRKLGQR